MYVRLETVALAVLLAVGVALPATAQSGGMAEAGSGYAGPPAPLPPAVLSRDAEGRATIRATRLPEGLVIDGVLDEAI
ncbi:MAG: hypothetical protein AB7N90_14630, partial [Vicinamibacterales bacterium]